MDKLQCKSKSVDESDVEAVDLEAGSADDQSTTSLDNTTQGTESNSLEMITKQESRTELSVTSSTSLMKKSALETWNKSLVMVPLTIAITLFGAAWANNPSSPVPSSSSFNRHVFFFLVTVNFYVSIVGIILQRIMPMVARCLHLVSFLCVLFSITLLLQAIVPPDLTNVPWFCLGLLLSVFGLVVLKLRSLP